MFNDRTSLLTHLATRRSGKPRDMVAPGPSDDELAAIVELASRTPDHGKLAPWRFVSVAAHQRDALTKVITAAYRAERPEADGERAENGGAKQERAGGGSHGRKCSAACRRSAARQGFRRMSCRGPTSGASKKRPPGRAVCGVQRLWKSRCGSWISHASPGESSGGSR